MTFVSCEVSLSSVGLMTTSRLLPVRKLGPPSWQQSYGRGDAFFGFVNRFSFFLGPNKRTGGLQGGYNEKKSAKGHEKRYTNEGRGTPMDFTDIITHAPEQLQVVPLTS